MRYLGFLSFGLVVGCAQDGMGRGAQAPAEPVVESPNNEAVLLQALVTEGSAECPAHVVDVQPGADILLDWSSVTIDVLGDPIEGNVAEGSATLHPYVDVTPDDVLAACGVLPRENLGPMVYLRGDEDVASRTISGTDLPAVGGIAAIHMVSHGQFVFLAFLLPEQDSVTTSLVVQ